MVRWKQRPVSDRLGGSITGAVVLLPGGPVPAGGGGGDGAVSAADAGVLGTAVPHRCGADRSHVQPQLPVSGPGKRKGSGADQADVPHRPGSGAPAGIGGSGGLL